MAKLDITRQNIFASTNKDGGIFYYLILGTSNYGCIHIKIRNVPAFKNIIGLKIDNIGYACINNIQHTPWRRFNFKNTTSYRRLNDQEYSLITNAIHDYMNGNIGFANDNTMMYMDEIARYNANLAKKVEESFEDMIDESSNISRYESNEEKAGGVKENDEIMGNNEILSESSDIHQEELPIEEIVDNTISEKPVVSKSIEEVVSAELVTSEDINDNSTEDDSPENPDNSQNIDKKTGIELIPAENIETEEIPTGIKCYNLITTSSTAPHYVKSKDAAYKSTTQLGRKVYRHIYTEEETFEIAHLETKCIILKYKVSNSIATHMKSTAMKIFKIAIKERSKRHDYAALFKMGLSVEEVAKETDMDIGKIRWYYNNYTVNANADNTVVTDVYNKWIDIIKNNDINKLLDVAFVSMHKFAESENISSGYAIKILDMIRYHIFKNPMIVIGIDKDIAFDKNKINAYIEELRNYHGRSSSRRDINNAKIWVIEKALSLEQAYIDSYDDHVDIMHGIKPIPDSVSSNDRDAFITMITNRFYFFKMISSKRGYTTDQNYAMNNNGSIAEYTMAFMCVDKRIRGVKDRVGSKNKNVDNSVIEAAT